MKTSRISQAVSRKETGTMEIGDIVRIKKCEPIPEVVDKSAEVVGLQMQGAEKYPAYPVWVKMTSGERKGRVYGFQYDEVALLPRADGGTAMKAGLAEQLAEILRNAAIEDKGSAAGALRVGGTVKVKKCDSMPEVVGESAEVVGLQMQEFEKYTVYPVWVKMTSGKHKGRIYGFRYDEVAVPVAYATDTATVRVTEQLEEMLKAMKAGGTVKVRKCDSMPEVVGESGEIVDMQVQEFEKYASYPVWVKLTSGVRKGKIYGFHYDEIVMVPKTHAEKRSRTKIDEQLEEILKNVTTIEEFAEIERAIDKVKGKVPVEPGRGFWEGKTPCWEMFRCPEDIKNECPAFKYQTLPCWQIEGTYSKLHGDGEKGHDTDICRNCRVYKRWGQGEPIEIKLRGKGFNRT